MRLNIAFLASCLCLVYVAAVPRVSPKIVGGSEANVDQYPSIAAVLYSTDSSNFFQDCVGSILNIRSVLTLASCAYGDNARRRIRVGSSYASSGGAVYGVDFSITHPDYDSWTHDSDIAILRTATFIVYNNNVQAALIAGPNYIPADNEVVWAAGWGATYHEGASSEQLRHVQIWTINQVTCRSRFTPLSWPVTDNMLCSGYLDGGDRGQCTGDYGSPIYHGGVIVGIFSWGYGCGQLGFPGVNTRISSFTTWIQEQA